MHARIWKPVLTNAAAAQATNIALEVARRSCQLVNIQRARDARDAEGNPYVGWHSPSVAGGDAGIALLAGYIHDCFPENGWDVIAHTYLSKAIDAYDFHFPDLGLFAGMTGLAFTAMLTSQDGKCYKGLRKQLDEFIGTHIYRFLMNAYNHDTFCATTYDLICGVTGIAAYLLSRSSTDSSASGGKVCHDVLKYLVTLTEPDERDNYCLILPQNIPRQERRAVHPYGYTDCGLAHGVPGLVSTLSLAMRLGWEVDGMKNGLTSLVQWLLAQKIEDEYGVNWPTAVDPCDCNGRPEHRGSRMAWCYGIPGIARTLFLAGKALDDENLQVMAISSLESLLDRPRKVWSLFSPNFCHGLAGILQVSLRMYQDTGSARIASLIEKVSDELLALYDPASIFGFRDRNVEGVWYDNPRLLEGAPGVALVLLAATQPIAPIWDRMFLLF